MKIKFTILDLMAIFIALNFASFSASAQDSSSNVDPTVKWTSLKSTDDLEFSYYPGSCTGSDAMFLRIENKSLKAIEVKWSLWENAESKTIELLPGQIRKAECSSAGDFILVDFLPVGQSQKSIAASINVTPKN